MRAMLRTFTTASLLCAAVAGPPSRARGQSVAEHGEATPPALGPVDERVENAVVQVFATRSEPDPFKPWTKQAPREVSGTGVVIGGKRILTNAHVVLYASQIQIQGNHGGDRISAVVQAIAPGIDLAVLSLEDPTFFDKHLPLARANTLPSVKDAVLAYGFPTGGTSLSITKGIVSRIDFTTYNFPVFGLRVQVDAPVNPGNSGGPAVIGDRMIGLVFSILQGAQNISYIIPCEEIDLFLADIADGKYDGKPALFDDFQTLQNDALRAFLKLDRSVEGIVVHRPEGVDGNHPLKEWDVITRIGDAKIDDEGMVRVGDLRVRFPYLVQKLARGGKVPLTLVRGGKELTVTVPVSATRPMVVPDLMGAYPPYFVFGPIVFSTASAHFVNALMSSKNSPLPFLVFAGNPLVTRRGERASVPGEELVVVSSPLFPHKLGKGYSNPVARVISTVNGTRIRNLHHLVQILRDARDEFVTFEFAGRFGEDLVLPRKEAIAATEEILNDNGIRSQGSPDVMAVWNERPSATR